MHPTALAERTAARLPVTLPLRQLLHVEHSAQSAVHVHQTGRVLSLGNGRLLSGAFPGHGELDLDDPYALRHDGSRAIVGSLLAHPRVRRVLVLGLGAATVPRLAARLIDGVVIDAVEADPAVIAVAGRWFGAGRIAGLALHHGDPRAFVRRAAAEGRRYDAIVVDASDAHYLPRSLMTLDFHREARGALAHGGLVIVHAHSRGRLRELERATLAAAWAGDLAEVRGVGLERVMVASPDGLPSLRMWRRRMLVCSARLAHAGIDAAWYAERLRLPVAPTGIEVLTDATASGELDALRRTALQHGPWVVSGLLPMAA